VAALHGEDLQALGKRVLHACHGLVEFGADEQELGVEFAQDGGDLRGGEAPVDRAEHGPGAGAADHRLEGEVAVLAQIGHAAQALGVERVGDAVGAGVEFGVAGVAPLEAVAEGVGRLGGVVARERAQGGELALVDHLFRLPVRPGLVRAPWRDGAGRGRRPAAMVRWSGRPAPS
jgi:hypothetical protein